MNWRRRPAQPRRPGRPRLGMATNLAPIRVETVASGRIPEPSREVNVNPMTRIDLGDIVVYRLTQADAEQTNQRRQDATDQRWNAHTDRPGWQAHVGEPCRVGDLLPAVVTRVGPDHASLKVLLDGNDTLWVPDAREGGDPGQWHPRATRW